MFRILNSGEAEAGELQGQDLLGYSVNFQPPKGWDCRLVPLSLPSSTLLASVLASSDDVCLNWLPLSD